MMNSANRVHLSLQCQDRFNTFPSSLLSLRSFMFVFCKSLREKKKKKMFSHQAEASIFSHKCVNGQTLIISLPGEMLANMIENYKDISLGIISYSFCSTSPRFSLSFFFFFCLICVYNYVCACVFMRI